jgi:hypothetical protein
MNETLNFIEQSLPEEVGIALLDDEENLSEKVVTSVS